MGKYRKLAKAKRLLKKIKKCHKVIENLSNEELAGKTIEFKERFRNGESLDRLLPEAFAAICEADKRVLGMFPYDVQIMAGIAMHDGLLAEMSTGEGKTLMATMPLYLNALTGRSCILMTTNDYLARRDAEEMGAVYEFMGLTVAAGVPAPGEKRFTNEKKKEIYQSDIVYTTHSAFGFDYLFHNLVMSKEERFLRDYYYVIVDEADSVLLDAAARPLVIAGAPRVQSNLYEMADFFVTTLEEGVDYESEEQAVWLTKQGAAYAETYFKIDNFYSDENFEINRHVTLALRAHVLFEKGKNYVVSDEGEIVLLDRASGRLMPGVKLRGGQNQAIEQKEGLKISPENRSIASITYQNMFLLFEKMAGMSGTISDAKDELYRTYGIGMVVIPSNKPIKRKDYPDKYYHKIEDAITEALELVIKLHQKNQPILIVASTIPETELISKLLYEEGIAHSVLNANNVYWEAEMIKVAGQMGAVTVSTSMAGRGTDIKLGTGVKELGGLAVIGIGRMNNIRDERQARGRAGRQGDPGFSQFFVSLEDEVVLQSGVVTKEKLPKLMEGASKRKRKKIINSAQKISEEVSENSRKRASDFDQVVKKQRELVYQIRNTLLDGVGISDQQFYAIAEDNIRRFLAEKREIERADLYRYILDEISFRLEEDVERLDLENKRKLAMDLVSLVKRAFWKKCHTFDNIQDKNEFCRIAILTAIDESWVEQVDYLQQLQSAVEGRVSAQRNPIYEYQQEAYEAFHKMEKTIMRNMIRNILLGEMEIDEKGKMKVFFP